MPRKTQQLALLGLCSLVLACADAASPGDVEAGGSARKQNNAQPTVAARVEKPARVPEAQGQVGVPLTATAPTPPRSILDNVPAHPATPATPADEADKSQAQPVAVEAGGSAREQNKEASAATQTAALQGDAPSDFDRPLSPEEVVIDRFVLASGVEAREPVGESSSFSSDTPKIFAFVQFANEKAAPFALRVHWEKLEGPVSPYGFKLEVPTAKRHRTWSWTKIRREPGSYRAVLRTLDGKEVASKEFVIEAAAPSLEE